MESQKDKEPPYKGRFFYAQKLNTLCQNPDYEIIKNNNWSVYRAEKRDKAQKDKIQPTFPHH